VTFDNLVQGVSGFSWRYVAPAEVQSRLQVAGRDSEHTHMIS